MNAPKAFGATYLSSSGPFDLAQDKLRTRSTTTDLPLRPVYRSMEWMNHLQWPAMAVTLLSAWLVAAQSKKWRQWGFWFFLLSNVLWVAWGWHTHAWALILLQFGLAILNIRGAAKND